MSDDSTNTSTSTDIEAPPDPHTNYQSTGSTPPLSPVLSTHTVASEAPPPSSTGNNEKRISEPLAASSPAVLAVHTSASLKQKGEG